MPLRSLTVLGRQLDAPNSEPFTMLKHDRQPLMLKFEEKLGMDERSRSSLYTERFYLSYYHYHHYPYYYHDHYHYSK